MRFKFECTCGKRLAAYSWMVGKATECPNCGKTLTIPTPERASEMMGAHGADSPTRYHVENTVSGWHRLALWVIGGLMAILATAVIAIYGYIYFHSRP